LRTWRAARPVGMAVLVGALLFAAYSQHMFSTSIFTMSLSYDARDMSALYGVTTRVLALASGAVLTAAIVMATPRRKYWFTVIGKRSLTIYLVHSMVLEIPRQLEWFDHLSGSGVTMLVVLG